MLLVLQVSHFPEKSRFLNISGFVAFTMIFFFAVTSERGEKLKLPSFCMHEKVYTLQIHVSEKKCLETENLVYFCFYLFMVARKTLCNMVLLWRLQQM